MVVLLVVHIFTQKKLVVKRDIEVSIAFIHMAVCIYLKTQLLGYPWSHTYIFTTVKIAPVLPAGKVMKSFL